MQLSMVKAICQDFMKTDHPVKQKSIILNGGDPLLHPDFIEISKIVRDLCGKLRLSTNGFLVPEYIHTFRKNDGIQVSVDGNKEIHDFIRGKGSYERAVKALELLEEGDVNHSISFTINKKNRHCIDHLLELCKQTGTYSLNCNIYQPVISSELEPLSFREWLEIRKYVKKCAEKKGIHVPETCIVKGCIGGVLGVSVIPSGMYWDCSRSQQKIGKFPQSISDCLFWGNISGRVPRNQFETCCRRLDYA